MAHSGLSIGTATGGGTILVDNIGGTLWPVSKLVVGGPGTATPVHAGAPLPVSGTTVAAGTQVVAGTVAISGTIPVSGAGGGGTVAVSSGTVTALAAGTQIVSGTVVTSGGSGPGTVAISGGTIGMLTAGTVAISGTVPMTHGRTLASTAVTANSGTTTIVTPGGGTQVRVYAALLSAGTTGAFILRSGNNLPLTGTISVDQYGGFTQSVTPPAWLYATAAGSSLQLVVTSGTPNIGGVISYWLEEE